MNEIVKGENDKEKCMKVNVEKEIERGRGKERKTERSYRYKTLTWYGSSS